ncbi:ferredoxin [Cryptosporangium sp. NPDC051539]|uniref:ferredoxin n=1 Tax=Cryptosporangium sp. NPDC051539 TaxID=3363962 RepID=UPI0037B4385D
MKLTVDEGKCVAAGLCVMTDDVVFDQDEATGIVTLLTDEPAPANRESAREAARICPAVAITIHEDAQ